ncbi:MAG: ribonuclease P protein component [Candidatus Paceibacterota bacterium]|jgi:ribonuclease P protein component
MLPRSKRLSVEQFNAVIEKGRVFNSTLFLMRILRVESSMRIASVVPQKIAKKATDRNKLRRKMYEVITPLLKNVVGEFHAIVLAKSTAIKAEFTDLTTDMRAIFVKAGILK